MATATLFLRPSNFWLAFVTVGETEAREAVWWRMHRVRAEPGLSPCNAHRETALPRREEPKHK